MVAAQEIDDEPWETEKRDIVADWRDEEGEERDAAADTRDSTADEREQLADERGGEMDARRRSSMRVLKSWELLQNSTSLA